MVIIFSLDLPFTYVGDIIDLPVGSAKSRVPRGLATLRSRALPQWYAVLTFLGLFVFLISAVSIRQNGFFSPEGTGWFIGFPVFALWILVSSILLVRKLGADTAAVAPPAPSPATA